MAWTVRPPSRYLSLSSYRRELYYHIGRNVDLNTVSSTLRVGHQSTVSADWRAGEVWNCARWEVTSKSAQLSAVNLPSANWAPADVSLADQISTDSNTLGHDAGVAATDASTLRGWCLDRDTRTSAASALSPCVYPNGQGASGQWWCKEDSATRAWADTEDNVSVAQQRAEIFSGILNGYILPVLFGLAGSLVFVIRTISDQIKNNTFSSVSPLRHLLRVWLGPLMGLVVSLFSSVIQLQNIGPFALAFLAGYAVEGLFSLFDNLVKAMTGSSNSGDRTAGNATPQKQ
jgi:hypothetical protein